MGRISRQYRESGRRDEKDGNNEYLVGAIGAPPAAFPRGEAYMSLFPHGAICLAPSSATRNTPNSHYRRCVPTSGPDALRPRVHPNRVLRGRDRAPRDTIRRRRAMRVEYAGANSACRRVGGARKKPAFDLKSQKGRIRMEAGARRADNSAEPYRSGIDKREYRADTGRRCGLT